MSQLGEGVESCPLRVIPHTPSLQVWEILVCAGSYPACPWGAPRLPYGGSSRQISVCVQLPPCEFLEFCQHGLGWLRASVLLSVSLALLDRCRATHQTRLSDEGCRSRRSIVGRCPVSVSVLVVFSVAGDLCHSYSLSEMSPACCPAATLVLVLVLFLPRTSERSICTL